MDENNHQLNNAVAECETDLEKMEEERRRQNLPQIPGRKIGERIKEWAKDEIYFDDEINQYAGELWISLAEYEEQIRSEHKGYEIELQYQQDNFNRILSGI